jgi:hypothetical protein
MFPNMVARQTSARISEFRVYGHEWCATWLGDINRYTLFDLQPNDAGDLTDTVQQRGSKRKEYEACDGAYAFGGAVLENATHPLGVTTPAVPLA